MGKKKQGGQQHAQQSFADFVSKANREALKPYILQVVGEVGNDISRRVMTKMAVLGNRVQALEGILMEKLDFTQDDLDNALFDFEDKITGYKKADRPAAEGDLLRLSMRIKKTDKEYGPAMKREFSNLGLPPYALGVDIFEKALIGSEIGNPVVVSMPEELKKVTGTDEIEFVVDCISELIAKPEPKKEELKNEENPNAAEGETIPELVSSTEPGEAG